MVEMKLYTERAKNTFIKLARRLQNLEPIWDKFIDYYQNEIIPGTWNSKGALMEGKRWEPLSEKYLKWKQKHYPGMPLLYATGKLMQAAEGGAGWYEDKKPDNLQIGLSGEDYFYWVTERENHSRKYFYTSTGDLPNRAWKYLIDITNEYLEEADDDK